MPNSQSDSLFVATAERIAALNVTDWDSLVASADVFMQRPYLEAMEAAAPANVAPRYSLLYRGAQPIAAVAMQLVRFEGRTGVARAAPLHGVAQFVEERSLILGTLAGWGHTGVALAPGVSAAEVWPELARVLDGLRRFEKSRGRVNVTVLKDVGAYAPDALLRHSGYERAPAGADMCLTLGEKWPTFDSYLASLNAKARNSVKRTLREVESAGYQCRALCADEVEAASERIDHLYGEVWANADVRPIRLSGRFFVELKARLGSACAVIGLKRAGRLDGFAVALKNRASCVGYYLGFERSIEAPLYLRLLVAMIEQGITWQVGSLSMGRTAEEPKARLGATPVDGWIWVKHRTPPMNWAVGSLLSSMRAVQAPTHRVFRAQEGV